MKGRTKRLLAGTSAAALLAASVVGGSLAYFTDSKSAVNVMTMGNVQIEQLEYERVVNASGNWVSTDGADKYGYTPDKLQEYTQGKPLYPAVFAEGAIKWDDRNGSQNASGEGSHQQSWGQVGASGSNQLFDDSVKNAIDKFVFVENTGESDAYVRTLIALEQGSVAAGDFEKIILTNANRNHWSWETVATDVEIKDGKGVASTYVIWCATYLGPQSNPTGVLAPGAVSYPSLLQVYMLPEATNEDAEAIDGNGNGTYDILVLSQAVQTAGFSDAATALETAFPKGENNANVAAWFGGMPIPTVVSTPEELVDALKDGGSAVLTADINMASEGNARLTIPENANALIDLNGHTLTSKDGGDANTMAVYVSRGATLTLEDSAGGGEIESSCYGVYVQPNATFVMNGGTISVSGNGVYDMGVIVWNAEFIMNAGEINAKYGVVTSNYWKSHGDTNAMTCAITIDDDCVIDATDSDVDVIDAPDTILNVPATLEVVKAANSTE